MRILMLPRYGRNGPSSRYRLWQYVAPFERAGHQVEVRPLLSEKYVADLYSKGNRGVFVVAAGYVKRFWSTPRRSAPADVVICEQELFPYLPAGFENSIRKVASRFILDYDDAAYSKYQRWPILRDKIGKIMATADAVVVGNKHLAEYAPRFSSRVYVVPTVVNLDRYARKQNYSSRGLVRIAWIGTPVTAMFLKPLLPVFRNLQQKYPNLRFRFIGAGQSACYAELSSECPEWSEETEAALLAECDIGIMPLWDNELSRGKCGLKLIQYMACGLPVVGSPIGENREIVDPSVGFLATTEEEWFETLSRLVQDEELRRRLGQNARVKVERSYSLERGFLQWIEILRQTCRLEIDFAPSNPSISAPQVPFIHAPDSARSR